MYTKEALGQWFDPTRKDMEKKKFYIDTTKVNEEDVKIFMKKIRNSSVGEEMKYPVSKIITFKKKSSVVFRNGIRFYSLDDFLPTTQEILEYKVKLFSEIKSTEEGWRIVKEVAELCKKSDFLVNDQLEKV